MGGVRLRGIHMPPVHLDAPYISKHPHISTGLNMDCKTNKSMKLLPSSSNFYADRGSSDIKYQQLRGLAWVDPRGFQGLEPPLKRKERRKKERKKERRRFD